MKHGGDLTEAISRYGGAADIWLDLSTGINPASWPVPHILKDIWQRLPSRAQEQALRDAARKAYAVPDGADVVAAAGTQALIQWLPRLATDGTVVVLGPTYSEHVAAWRSAGRDVVTIGHVDRIPDHARHMVIVNPNNPDGRIVDRMSITAIAGQIGKRGGWLVIDEAFADVDPRVSAAGLVPELPIVILRSFGKFYGLAGIRLGFAIAAPAIARRMADALGPWAVSGPALQIGTAALRDERWAAQARIALATQAIKLDGALIRTGFEIVGGTSLFRLARHRNARQIHHALARQHIWCRSFDWADDLLRFGLPPDDAALASLATALGSVA